jgi:hypothetical protein
MRALVPVCFLLLLGCEDSSSSSRPPPSYPPPGYYGSGPGPAPGPTGPPPSGPPLRSDEISGVINASYPKFTDCYMRSESYMTGKAGTVTIFFEAAPAGNVASASDQAPPGATAPMGNALRDPKLTQCLVAGFFQLRFRTSSESTPASWTLQFSP